MTHSETKQQIQRLTGVDDREYFEAVLDSGEKFLRWYLGEGPALLKEIAETPAYWNWYANQFDIMDQVFIHTYTCAGTCDGNNVMKRLWYVSHEPNMVPGFPSKSVFDKVYENMMQEVLKTGKEAQRV
ncbi:MAG TPA: hypothetical protein DIW47_11020 [Bacteroidetes bacterium]|nr:hypothetical protein [Bacteroidota bacterium]